MKTGAGAPAWLGALLVIGVPSALAGLAASVSREVPQRDDSEDTRTLYSNVMKFTIEAPKVEESKPAK